MRQLLPLLLLIVSVFLQGCAGGQLGEDILESRLEPKGSGVERKQARLDAFLSANGRRAGNFQGVSDLGSDRLTGAAINYSPEFKDSGERIKLNLVGASIAQAAKSVLGDTLELNYSIDPAVQGAITLQTSKPMSKRALLGLFEDALRDSGAVLLSGGNGYRIVPAAETGQSVLNVENTESGGIQPGVRARVVPLKFVSAEEMKDVLTPMIPSGMLVRADARRNALVLSGTANEINAIRETISVFDVDWMRGMSFALVPVKSSSPESITRDLDQVFETKTGPLKGILKFIPNRRLKSVLVISSRSKYVKDATKWIRKLDVLAESSEEGLHVYRVQNRTAGELASILQSILKRGGGELNSQGAVAPKLTPTEITGEPTSGPETPVSGPGSNAEYESESSSPDAAGGSHVRVVADEPNNALLIYATHAEFERVLAVLEQVDTMPNQVLLEAVIAEVSLDDDLKFGVRWFFGDERQNGTFSDLAGGAVASVFPGFSYFLKANDIGFSLNALSSVTDVQVLSSPSLVVLDNRTATLQVGDQVPIVTQESKGTASSDAPVVNKVELKDTGVILNVTPRVNDNGRVILDIEQEVSNVVKTTTSGIDSPTIRQRKIKTSVVINDGEALALGGLIQERETTGKSKVPVLGDVPLLGSAFRQKTNQLSRTELIIFIRPRVIRDFEEARRITRELREELRVVAPRIRVGEPTPADELVRILE